jgi:hypothetical protein
VPPAFDSSFLEGPGAVRARKNGGPSDIRDLRIEGGTALMEVTLESLWTAIKGTICGQEHTTRREEVLWSLSVNLRPGACGDALDAQMTLGDSISRI